jgi:hypothetical protein
VKSSKRATRKVRPPANTGIRSGGLRLSPDVFNAPSPPTPPAPAENEVAEKPAKPRRVKRATCELAARARELRDRWKEEASCAERDALPAAKYDIGRLLPDPATLAGHPVALDNASMPSLPHRLLLSPAGRIATCGCPPR